MTIQDIINQYGQYSGFILAFFAVIIVLAVIGRMLMKDRQLKPPVSYAYSVLVYAATIPGIFSVMLVIYNLFLLRSNLLNLNVAVYYVPIIGMIASLVIINSTFPLKQIPGFERLSGLAMVIAIAFIITYVLQRMFFGVLFFGSFSHLILMFLVMVFLLRQGWKRFLS